MRLDLNDLYYLRARHWRAAAGRALCAFVIEQAEGTLAIVAAKTVSHGALS
jgi:hypothetical protein